MESFMQQIQIYDTTLRDGTQSEGFTLSSNDKVRIAQKLDELGVAFIEGGWPGSNPKDVEFFERARDMQWHQGAHRFKDAGLHHLRQNVDAACH
jgi:2-isopropylmalate synthase